MTKGTLVYRPGKPGHFGGMVVVPDPPSAADLRKQIKVLRRAIRSAIGYVEDAYSEDAVELAKELRAALKWRP